MIENVVCPKSSVTARVLLKNALPGPPCSYDEAARVAEDLRARGWYIDPNYLTDVWRRENDEAVDNA